MVLLPAAAIEALPAMNEISCFLAVFAKNMQASKKYATKRRIKVDKICSLYLSLIFIKTELDNVLL